MEFPANLKRVRSTSGRSYKRSVRSVGGLVQRKAFAYAFSRQRTEKGVDRTPYYLSCACKQRRKRCCDRGRGQKVRAFRYGQRRRPPERAERGGRLRPSRRVRKDKSLRRAPVAHFAYRARRATGIFDCVPHQSRHGYARIGYAVSARTQKSGRNRRCAQKPSKTSSDLR